VFEWMSNWFLVMPRRMQGPYYVLPCSAYCRFRLEWRFAVKLDGYCAYIHLPARAFARAGYVLGDSIAPGAILNCHLQLL